jgi:UDP-2,3-diacylglucosamine hydrolase
VLPAVTHLFVSDLHLDPADAVGVRRFLEFVDREALHATTLYVLGDLFEAWVGDDDDDPLLGPIFAAFDALNAAGVSWHFMHGNRDFLVGSRFSARTGCRLLGELTKIELFGEPVLLTHGDLLCTDDVRYQTLRAELRAAAWQRDFLAKPLAERREIAADLRKQSAAEIASKREEIMDVNQRTVERTMRAHGVTCLLHGHTHRPAVHRFELDGEIATRIVLGAWYEQASVVRWDETGFRLETLSYR